MDRFRKRLDWVLDTAVNTLMIVLLVAASAQVFWRYVLNSPLAWSEEFARYTFVWLVFLAACIAFRDGKHMAVDLVPPLLSPGLRRIQGAIVKIILAVFFIIVLFVSPEIIMLTMDQPSASLSIPIGLVYLSFPFSLLIMLIYLILDIAACRKQGDTQP